jgi:hypothetical protein
MAFNLSLSRKPEVDLYRNLIHENISMYGIPVKYLYSERINKNEVFKDFSHFKVENPDSFKEIYLMPENPEDWEGDSVYNAFGLFNQWTQHLFISRKTILELYPDFDDTTGNRAKIVNSLIVLPSETILEITNMESYEPGVNNLWAFNDEVSSYKLSVKIYDQNIADEGVRDIKDTIKISEDGGENGDQDDVIFEYDEPVDTSGIDKFFNELVDNMEEIEKLADEGDDKGRKPSNTNSPFGNLS